MKRILLIILLLISLSGFAQQGFSGSIRSLSYRGIGGYQKVFIPTSKFTVLGQLKNYGWICIENDTLKYWSQAQDDWVPVSGSSSYTFTSPLLNTSNTISINGISGVGNAGQVPISNGTQWAYHYPFNHDSARMYSFETGRGLEVIDGGDDLDTIRTDGTVITAYAAKTSAYTITNDDHTIHCTSGTFTVMLPPANAANAGQEFLIKNTGAGTITIDGDGSETIDAGTTYPLAQYKFILIKSTGAGVYLIIGNN